MKSLRFLPILFTLLMVSCVKTTIEGESFEGNEGEGLLKIGVAVDDGLQILTRASSKPLDPSLLPPEDSVYIDLYRKGKATPNAYRETWNRIFFGQYADVKDTLLRVNGGEWRMLAFHGDSTACGFDKPYFLADEYFTVKGYDDNGTPEVTEVDAVVKVSNVRITVNFDKTVSGSFYDYFVRLTNLDKDRYRQILRYQANQKKDAYMMPSDSLQIEFMAQYEYGDESSWKYAVLDTVVTNPNDHLFINLSMSDHREGDLSFTIKTDSTIVKESSEVLIKEEWLPQDPPQVIASGFDQSGDHAVLEGDVEGNAATVSAVARAGMKNFFVRFESTQLASLGLDIPIGQDIDLADESVSNMPLLDKLKAAGMSWSTGMAGSRKLTYLTLTNLLTTINENIRSQQTAVQILKMTVRVVDDVDHYTDKVYTVTSHPVNQTLVIPVERVWANKIVSPVIKYNKGVSSLFRLQMSQDGGSTWTDCASFVSAANSEIDYGTLSVEPGKAYKFRSIYNGNENLVSNVVSLTTEELLQVANPGFEDYLTTYMTVKIDVFNTSYQREYYLPGGWWAVNSKKTMPSSHSTSGNNYKNFPCTGYSATTFHGGEKSAVVFTGNVDWWNTAGTALGSNVPGEIWIGTADDSGNHQTDGHAFASRPSSMKFWYRYSPNGSETFVVKVWLKNAEGAVIASAEILDGQAASSWTECELPLVYTDLNSKAASIYISFASCASGEVMTDQMIELGGKNQSTHIGSTLWIDDVLLTY